jgi:hypothetical protein
MGKKQWKDWNTFTHSISSFEHNPYTYYFSKFESTFGVNGMCTWKQGRINAHLTGGVQISLGGGGVHWCATKGADRAVVYIFRHIAITLFCGPCDQLIKNLSP